MKQSALFTGSDGLVFDPIELQPIYATCLRSSSMVTLHFNPFLETVLEEPGQKQVQRESVGCRPFVGLSHVILSGPLEESNVIFWRIL